MKNSLTRKFVSIVSLLTSILIAILVVLIILVTSNSQSQQSNAFVNVLENEKSSREALLKNGLLQKGQSIMVLLAQNSAALIVGYDFDTLEQLAANGKTDPEIAFVTFYDKDNKPLTKVTDQTTEIKLKQKIMFDGELVGQVEVGLDDASVKKNIADAATRVEQIIADTGHAKEKALLFVILLVSAVSVVGVVLLCFAIFLLLSRIVIKPIHSVIAIAERISAGDLSSDSDMDIKSDTNNDEISQLLVVMNQMVNALKTKVYLAEQIAKGDLSVEVELASESDTLGKSLQNMVANLNQVFGRITKVTDEMASGSGQVATSSQTISEGASRQASSLEEIGSSTDDIRNQSRINADNAAKANDLAKHTQDTAIKGDTQMKSMILAINEISDSSGKIAKIIKVIDEIAFQTNLLALNAAVEAARAGKYGKGFAVVAEEVRSLAARCAEAAKETTDLIESAAPKVENGISIASQTADVLQEILENITNVAGLVSEISAASQEQAEGISEINKGLEQIGNVTQQNAANTEETSSAADELTGLAMQMKEMMTKFKLQNHTIQPDTSEVFQTEPAAEKTIPLIVNNREQRGSTITLDDDTYGRY
ncbi:HAMP domain-containing protein [bacterium]|nr:HAMP domain-containing protein [bacterium]